MASRSILSFGDFHTIVWNMIPQVWRESDDAYGKSLQLIVYTMSQHMYYYFYNKIVHLDELFDPDLCPEKYLHFLSGMVGWTLIGSDASSWREQIKAAPLLYKLKGTKRGLLLAEKLIGYSVFMSELYRDHIGDAVSKERIFNNTPDTVKLKPWFRNTLRSLEGELLPGNAESDQFDSYNSTGLVKLDAFGSVIRPRVVSNTRKLIFTPSSTTPRYDNTTGKYSIARYAKLPRLNIVLKYDNDLDLENSDGSVKQNNFTGALDLLLQFKPFHVLIQNLEVRYDLSEFIFDQTTISSDTITSEEELDSAVVLELDRAENTINYSSTPAVDITIPTSEVPTSSLENKGVISSIYQILDLNLLSPVKEDSLYSVSKKALPVKAFSVDNNIDTITLAVNEGEIVTKDNFVVSISTSLSFYSIGKTIVRSDGSFIEDNFIQDTIITISGTSYNNTNYTISFVTDKTLTLDDTPVDEVALATITYTISPNNLDTNQYIIEDSVGNSNIIYNPGHDIISYKLSKLLSNSVLDFKTMLSSQHDTIDFVEAETAPISGFSKILSGDYVPGLDNSNILSISINTQPYRSSITTTFDTQSLVLPTIADPTPLSRPWDLREIQTFIDGPLSLVIGESYVTPGYVIAGYASDHSISTPIDIFKDLYDHSILIILETAAAEFIILQNGIDYYFDNETISLNSVTISGKLTVPEDTYNFILTSKLHVIYLSRITYENETQLGILSRGFRYKSRINNKFSRQFLINSLQQQTLSGLIPTQIISVDGKTKQKTALGIKKCKTPTNIYTRSSLKNEVVDNLNIVSRYPLNRMDESKWTVHAPEFTAYYLGDQKITNNWWGNYYEAKFDVSEVPYTDVDVSEEAQLKHVSSDQWLSALRTYNSSDPKDFLVTRTSDENRKIIWNRSSCKFASVPFIRSRRDSIQVFRKDVPTFTRSEESSDYLVDTSVPPRLDNYKYILSDGTDVSRSYFSPGFSIPEQVLVTIDRGIGQKATIDSSGYGLSFPESDTYYNNYSSDVSAETYFTQLPNSEYRVKTSLYAGNIPIGLDPTENPGFTDKLDELDLLISGLINIVDNFTTSVDNQATFTLSESNLFVNWINVDTGDTVTFGYYAPADTSPNINVFLNGILLNYGTQWNATFDRIKTINILVPTDAFDTVRVEYQILPGTNENVSMPPVVQIPYTIDVTLIGSDITTIKAGNRYILDLPVQSAINGIPCVSWYSSITNNYISSGTIPEDYQPFSLYKEAVPNMLISLNGIAIEYKQDWLFFLRTENNITVASIAFSPKLSLTLDEGDTIKVEYFSEL